MVILLPDGVEMELPLEFMAVKDAVFVPTLKLGTTKAVIRGITNMLEYEVKMQTAIQDGYLGVMVWRIS